jgi:hypothetical protein
MIGPPPRATPGQYSERVRDDDAVVFAVQPRRWRVAVAAGLLVALVVAIVLSLAGIQGWPSVALWTVVSALATATLAAVLTWMVGAMSGRDPGGAPVARLTSAGVDLRVTKSTGYQISVPWDEITQVRLVHSEVGGAYACFDVKSAEVVLARCPERGRPALAVFVARFGTPVAISLTRFWRRPLDELDNAVQRSSDGRFRLLTILNT